MGLAFVRVRGPRMRGWIKHKAKQRRTPKRGADPAGKSRTDRRPTVE